MSEKQLSKSINAVVAENLAYWMAQAGMKQAALADKAGVSQKTISNYLNPEQRGAGKTGKEASAKLGELDKIAKALHIEVWQLTREIASNERAMYEAFEKAYLELKNSAHAVEQISENERIAASTEIRPKLITRRNTRKTNGTQGV